MCYTFDYFDQTKQDSSDKKQEFPYNIMTKQKTKKFVKIYKKKLIAEIRKQLNISTAIDYGKIMY